MRLALFLALILLGLAAPAAAQPMMQTVTASVDGLALPPSTGQMIDPALLHGLTCPELVRRNLDLAAERGYRVEHGSFTDPASGITITQGCDGTPAAFEAAPAHPFAGGRPAAERVAAPALGAGTAVLFVIGQSNAGNYGVGRRTQISGRVWDYAGQGAFFLASDPFHNSEDGYGIDASPWVAVGERLLGRRGNNGEVITQVVIAQRAIGATSIARWAPGGDKHAFIINELRDLLDHVVAKAAAAPSLYILWQQGETDAGQGTTGEDYQLRFAALRGAIRRLTDAPIHVAVATMCNLREEVAYPPAAEAYAQPPEWFIHAETARQTIRAAQRALVNGSDVKPGPNTDLIAPAHRWDGCHLGPRGLAELAARWVLALTP